MAWTAEQILALAPDSSSVKNGKALAVQHKWVTFGGTDRALWGECQGSGKTPYRTQIDLNEPAFRCSCPSRKFPCKHGLGLFLLLAEQPVLIENTSPPGWVTEWLDSRSQRAEKQSQTREAAEAPDPVKQQKRLQERYRKSASGMDELKLWLQDAMRQGLVTLQQESYAYWDHMAARMVDAQAPGIARQLREGISLVHSGADWSEKLLAHFGKLYLLAESFQRLESLPFKIQADIRTQIGWAFTQEEVLRGDFSPADAPVIDDRWSVLGQHIEEDDRLKARRTWLWGLTSNQFALLLEFAHGTKPFETSYPLGSVLSGKLAFYPSAYPLRAVLKNRKESVTTDDFLLGQVATVNEVIATYSTALTQNPWLTEFPLSLKQVIPIIQNDRWIVRDSNGYFLPLAPYFSQPWQLFALSGGHSIDLFGEWNGTYFLPFSTVTAGHYTAFRSER